MAKSYGHSGALINRRKSGHKFDELKGGVSRNLGARDPRRSRKHRRKH